MVKQINGQYKVSSPALKELHDQAMKLIDQLRLLRDQSRAAGEEPRGRPPGQSGHGSRRAKKAPAVSATDVGGSPRSSGNQRGGAEWRGRIPGQSAARWHPGQDSRGVTLKAIESQAVAAPQVWPTSGSAPRSLGFAVAPEPELPARDSRPPRPASASSARWSPVPAAVRLPRRGNPSCNRVKRREHQRPSASRTEHVPGTNESSGHAGLAHQTLALGSHCLVLQHHGRGPGDAEIHKVAHARLLRPRLPG